MTGLSVHRRAPAPRERGRMRGRVRERVAWVVAVLGIGLVLLAVVGSLLGWSLLIFRSGSMSPDIPAGAAAVSRPLDVADVSTGDVVSVMSKTGDRITHRVVDVAVGPDGTGLLRLRGDANAGPDSEVYRAASVDRVVVSLPLVGYPIAVALSPVGLVVLGCAALALVVVAFGGERRRGAVRGSHAARSTGRRRTGRGAAAAAAATTAVVVTVGGTTGTLAAFNDTATLTTGAYAANPYFTCASAVSGVASPYLWWRLDETPVAPVADSSGNARPGLMVGSATTIRTGPAACGRDSGGSLRFDGSSYVGQPDARAAITAPDTYTSQVWFQTTTTRGGMLIGFGNSRTGASNQHDRHLYLTSGGRLVYGVYPGAVRTIASPQAYNDGAWHQAVTTLSSGGQRLYVDGELVASDARVTGGQGITGWWRVAYDNLDGWPDRPASDSFAGSLDDVAIYSSALSAAQVSAGYRAGLTG